MNKQILKHITRYILIVLIIITAINIFDFSGDNGKTSSSKSKYVSEIILKCCSKEYRQMDDEEKTIMVNLIEPYVRKAAHLGIYMLLGLLVMGCAMTYKGKSYKKAIISLILVIIYASTDEIHQTFISERTGKVTDVLIDSAGAILGIILIWGIISFALELKEYNRNKKELKNQITKEENKKQIKIENKKNIIFIASTGGHLNELMQLKPIFNNYNYHIITEKTKVDDSLKEEYNNKIDFLIYGTKKYPIKYIFKFLANCFISLFFYFKYQPDVIITTGTHTAVPMCYIAKIFGSKVIFIETFANRNTKTVAGKIIYPIADTFVVQWEEMKKLYPKAKYWGWLY